MVQDFASVRAIVAQADRDALVQRRVYRVQRLVPRELLQLLLLLLVGLLERSKMQLALSVVGIDNGDVR